MSVENLSIEQLLERIKEAIYTGWKTGDPFSDANRGMALALLGMLQQEMRK